MQRNQGERGRTSGQWLLLVGFNQIWRLCFNLLWHGKRRWERNYTTWVLAHIFFHQHYILLFSLTVIYTLRRSPALWYFPPNFLILEFFCTNFIADISYSRFNFCKVNFGYVSSSPVFSSISSSIAEAFVNAFTFSILFPFVLYRCCYLSIWVAR